jgi:hypothetical protein
MGHEADDRDQSRDMSQRDEEALWRSIVENYGERVDLEAQATDRATEQPGDQPGAESADATDGPGATVAPEPATSMPPQSRREDPTEARDWLDAYDDPEDHFVPPEPERVAAPEPPRLLAWAGVFGVPLVVLLLVVLQVTLPAWASLLCLAWFVGGFGYLVATMRREPPDDDWDDGARL